MNIKEKLKISQQSRYKVCWLRESGKIRLYQGALHWAESIGLLITPVIFKSSILTSTVIFTEYDELSISRWLANMSLITQPEPWGWSLQLNTPRDFQRENFWIDAYLMTQEMKPYRKSRQSICYEHPEIDTIMNEIVSWPTDQLSPLTATKAIRRWQLRLTQSAYFGSDRMNNLE